jgi:hypothetical protein
MPDLKIILKDIMGLTKINYNSCNYNDGLPVTVRFTRMVGDVLTMGSAKKPTSSPSSITSNELYKHTVISDDAAEHYHVKVVLSQSALHELRFRCLGFGVGVIRRGLGAARRGFGEGEGELVFLHRDVNHAAADQCAEQ